MTAVHATADTSPPLHGPYDDDTTSRQAQRAADAIRYLNYATREGISEPNTVAVIAGHLADAAYRLPQLLAQLSDWLHQETTAGRIAADRPQPPWTLTVPAREQLGDAAEQAGHLANALDSARQFASTLYAAEPAGPARATEHGRESGCL